MADLIVVPILLRPGCVVQLRLPPDLTASEASRIASVVHAYVDEDGVFSQPKPSWAAYAEAMQRAHPQPEEQP